MGHIADNLAAIDVTVTSPDSNIKAKVWHKGKVKIGFRPDTYSRYSDQNLAQQLSRLCTLGMTGYARAQRRAMGTPEKPTESWDARDRRYKADFAEMDNYGISAGRVIKVRAVGMMNWEVKIKPGTVKELSESEFVAECHTAMESLVADQRGEVIALKDKHFGLDLPQFLRKLPPLPPGAKAHS